MALPERQPKSASARPPAEPKVSALTLPSDQDASGRSFGEAELEALRQVLRSGVLTSTKGTFTRRFEEAFAELLGARHAYACSSGTSAIHAAVAAIDPEPGEEVVVSPITDMGALTPILYQGAIPVFADVDPATANVTAESIERRLSERTRAILVTHLFGNPCQMDPILELADRHGVPVIEDCAQAHLASSRGRYAGTLGVLGCFSLQQGKHITTGEGGVVVTSDPALARRVRLFINKAWGYGDPQPDHSFLALNSRMSELQAAVAVAQLEKLPGLVQRRIAAANALTAALEGTPGLGLPVVRPNSVHVYWRYTLRVDACALEGGALGLAARLRDLGILTVPRYIQKPAFECAVFTEQRTFGRSRFPFTLARPEAVDYDRERYPGTYRALSELLVVPWNENLSSGHVELLADRLRSAAAALA